MYTLKWNVMENNDFINRQNFHINQDQHNNIYDYKGYPVTNSMSHNTVLSNLGYSNQNDSGIRQPSESHLYHQSQVQMNVQNFPDFQPFNSQFYDNTNTNANVNFNSNDQGRIHPAIYGQSSYLMTPSSSHPPYHQFDMNMNTNAPFQQTNFPGNDYDPQAGSEQLWTIQEDQSNIEKSQAFMPFTSLASSHFLSPESHEEKEPEYQERASGSPKVQLQFNIKVRERAENWGAKEIDAYVEILLKHQKEIINMRKYPEIWSIMSKELAMKGYDRSGIRCKNKWKALVAKYKRLCIQSKLEGTIGYKATQELNAEPFSRLKGILSYSYQLLDQGLVKKYKSGFVKPIEKDKDVSFQFQPDESSSNRKNRPTFSQFKINLESNSTSKEKDKPF